MKFGICATFTDPRIMPSNAVEENDGVIAHHSIEINSIEDLVRLADIKPDGIVIYKSICGDEKVAPYTIEIYNCNRE